MKEREQGGKTKQVPYTAAGFPTQRSLLQTSQRPYTITSTAVTTHCAKLTTIFRLYQSLKVRHFVPPLSSVCARRVGFRSQKPAR